MTNLKSIQEHNESVRIGADQRRLMSGVACPKCGKELEYEDNALLLTSPPQRRTWCFDCSEIQLLLA